MKKNMENKKQLIANSILFAGISPDQLAELADISHVKTMVAESPSSLKVIPPMVFIWLLRER